MLVIQGNITTATGGTPVSTGRLFPADRCTWEEVASADGFGYRVTNARFYDGVTATAIPIAAPVLGVIGKSGRFVALTDNT